MKSIFCILGLVICSANVTAQMDLSIKWNTHEEGELTDENPFNGGFTIENVGETTIAEGDTLFFAYLFNEVMYDLTLSEGLATGQILENDFEPGESIVIPNTFLWPPYWDSGETLNACIAVFGVGVASVENWYANDYYPENNRSCIYAVLPEYTVSVEEEQKEITTLYYNQHQLVLSSIAELQNSPFELQVRSITGKMVHNSIGTFSHTNQISIGDLPKGLYLAFITYQEKTVSFKFIIG